MRSLSLVAILVASCSFKGEPGTSVDAAQPAPDAAPSADAAPFSNERLGTWSNTDRGASQASSDVSGISVSTSTVSTQQSLFLVAVSTKPHREVATVSGLGLSWSPLGSQCGAREQSGVSVWIARGTGSGSQPDVVATLESSAQTAVGIVVQYSAAADQVPSSPTFANRENGDCPAGDQGLDSDDETYSVSLDVSPPSLLVGAVSLREHDHEDGSLTEVLEIHSGTAGGDSGLVILEALPTAQTPLEASGNFVGEGNAPPLDLGNDWGAIFFELR